MNQLLFKPFIDFIPQPADSGFHHIGLGVEMIVPHMFHDHGFGNDPSGMAHQVFQQRKLQRLQPDRFPFPNHLPGQQVDRQVSHRQPRGVGYAAGPPDQGLHTRQEFGKRKGFWKVIVRTGLQSFDPVIDAFQGLFLTTMALLVGLATGVGWFMARRAVSGVTAITRTAQGISAGTLEKRVPVRDRGDEIDQLAMTFNQMLDRIQTLVTEIRQMGDNIAHDLKSPLTRIRGMAEITLTTGESLSGYQAMAASAIEECDRLLDMINTMLMISRTEAGVDRPIREEIDLACLIRDACNLFRTMAEDKGLTLDCDIPERCSITGDIRAIQRMLANLVDNAIKYTASGGTVRVVMPEWSENNTVITVTDTGCGISEADLPHIFERFYRCDQSRSRSGTGLGLSLARAIARAHGGDISVESRPGHGSAFTVSLPAA